MRAGQWLIDVAIGLGAALVVALLHWTAVERARLRRQWLHLQRRLDPREPPFDWCVAVSVAAGCV